MMMFFQKYQKTADDNARLSGKRYADRRKRRSIAATKTAGLCSDILGLTFGACLISRQYIDNPGDVFYTDSEGAAHVADFQ